MNGYDDQRKLLPTRAPRNGIESLQTESIPGVTQAETGDIIIPQTPVRSRGMTNEVERLYDMMRSGSPTGIEYDVPTRPCCGEEYPVMEPPPVPERKIERRRQVPHPEKMPCGERRQEQRKDCCCSCNCGCGGNAEKAHRRGH